MSAFSNRSDGGRRLLGAGLVALLLLLMLLQAVKKALKISMSPSNTTAFGEFMGSPCS